MDSIVPLTRADIGDVSLLYQKHFNITTASARAASYAYFEQLYLNNPWHENSIMSLVLKTHGRVSGFLGVIPFPLTYRGRTIRAAICGTAVVDPALSNPLAGANLHKIFLSGSQDVSYTDANTETAIKLWKGLGGTTLRVYSVQWLRVIRQTQFAAQMRNRGTVTAPFSTLSKPLSLLIDTTFSVIPKSPTHADTRTLHAEEISSHDLFTAVHQFSSRFTLAPIFTEASLAWLLTHAEEKSEYGPLRKIALFTPEHTLQGWFLYYPNAGGTGRVLQMGVSPQTADAVLRHIITDAYECGSIALTGRMEPHYGQELTSQNCKFTHRTSSLAVHSPHAEITNAFHQGNAFLMPLEAH